MVATLIEKLRYNRLAQNSNFRRFFSELIGTYLLTALVLCALANAVIAGKDGEHQAPVVMATIGAGLGVMIALYTAFGVSGGHINPVVTAALFSIGHIGVFDLFLYQVAQYIGGFLAGGTAYFFYSPILDSIDGGKRVAFGPNGTAKIFVTMPHPAVGAGRAFADQIFTSGIFMLIVLAVVDQRNVQMPRYLQPLIAALGFMGIVQCCHSVGGATINNARDFSPRVFLYLVGYGSELFTAQNYAFWIPLIGPYAGGVVGAWVYEIFFGWPLACIRKAEEAEKAKSTEVEMATEEKRPKSTEMELGEQKERLIRHEDESREDTEA